MTFPQSPADRREGRGVLTACLTGLLVAAVAARVVSSFGEVTAADITVWGDRDLWRALNLDGAWPTLGPESNGGTQLPGGAFYSLLAAILGLNPSLWAAQMAVAGLFAASTLLLGWSFWRSRSPLAGALVAAALAGSGLLPSALKVWNPGYLLFFATLATLAAERALRRRGPLALVLFGLAAAVGLQIHLQTIWLIVGVGLAALLPPRHWTWRHGLVLLLAFLAPYLPSLSGEGLRLLVQAASTPGDAIANYAVDDFQWWQKGLLLATLLGGDGGLEAAQTLIVSPLAVVWLPGDAAAVICCLGYLAMQIGRRPRTGDQDRSGRLFALIVLTHAAVIILFFVNPRHVVTAAPAVAVMTGLAAEAAIRRWLRAGRPAGVAGGVLLALLLAARPLLLSHFGEPESNVSLRSPAAQQEIAATVKARFFAGREAFESHAALFQREPHGRWQLVGNGATGAMAFIFATAPVTPVAGDLEGCLAILPKSALNGDFAGELAKAPPFAGLAPSFAGTAAESPHFVYAPYSAADGNCLKSFANAYLPTAFESRYLAPDPPLATALTDGGSALFVIPQPGRRFPLAVELQRSGPLVTAVLHGRLLRGYTGLPFMTIARPGLCFLADGATRTVPFGGVTVGSPQKGALAPWRSPSFGLPEGNYRLWLSGFEPGKGRALAVFLGHLAMPSLNAEPPAAGDDAGLPPGCGG